MDILKKHIPINSAINSVHQPDLILSVQQLIEQSQDGVIALDMQGKILAINEEAANLLGSEHNALANQFIWQQVQLNPYSRKRQFIQARKCFLLAQQGMTQQFTWIERTSQKPVVAYNIMINKVELHGTSVIFVTLINILQAKITEWVLWSLARIGNHGELNVVIDEILKIVSEAFSADYAAVCLVDSQRTARTVSYFVNGHKKENISYALPDTPCDSVIKNKAICHITDVQKEFPLDELLITMQVNSYLAGPIINAQEEVVGLLSIFTIRKLEMNDFNCTLFRLFLGRIDLEIERLLNQRRLQFLASIPQQDPNPVIRILPTGEVIFANNQGKNIIKQWNTIHPGIPEQLLKEAHKAQTTDQIVRVEMAADSKIYLFTLIWVNEFKQINIYGTDITQLKSTEQTMLNLARFDALTHIANRQYFEEKLVEKIHEHQIENKHLGLLLIDLDNFKAINDTLGHHIGDKLLQIATKRMVRCIRQEDFIARIGGDEFIVLVHHANTNIAQLIAEKIIRVLSKSFQFGDYQLKISASIGIAIYSEEKQAASDLMHHADLAMYQAKKSGKNNFALFSKSLHYAKDKRDEVIRKELKLAVAKNELYIDYQPQIDIISNKIIGIEALLRWEHPQEGLIFPGEFIPLAEKTGCIHSISQWLIEQSLHDYRTLLATPFDGKLSINVSLLQLNDARFIDSLNDNLLQEQINKDQIILDISERIIAPNFNKIAKYLGKIHKQGLQICLDNFGSPQVSLPKLLALPLDYLKLDQQLLHGIEKNMKNRMLLKGVIKLAQDLNIQVIQKGIETTEQHQIIKSLGCNYAQGYFYCEPIRFLQLQKTLNTLRIAPNN
ncbi:EAL domain-containing protein [uncultured Legionella sp.]|uniref:EAL domain-containing protein n=1 Tax=uncultured Legionella sp. TaxID=210934 RepID=UPI00261607CF|nr:EAL domain-containing protein [uncultured Legionella sp.]